MIIPLCDLPEGCSLQVTSKRTAYAFCVILLRTAIPSRTNRSMRWCALTAPFHPCLWRRSCDRRPSAVCFLLHPASGHPDLALASILSCEAPTFLRTTGKPAAPRSSSRLTVAISVWLVEPCLASDEFVNQGVEAWSFHHDCCLHTICIWWTKRGVQISQSAKG